MYILDPKDMRGPDFPGETFRVLKEKKSAAIMNIELFGRKGSLQIYLLSVGWY